MCEFCPRVGRCSVCDHVTQPLKTAPPSVRKPGDNSGYVVDHQGVTVRFDRHSDALACLGAFPTARVY
jgi:hypothetical protein